MKKPSSKILLFLFFLGTVLSCKKEDKKPLFVDLNPADSGFVFTNSLSHAEAFNMIDYLYYYDGGGVAVGDLNNDGLSDIYMVSNEGDNALFLNKGNMQFQDVTEIAGLKSPGLWKTGVSMADVNGDGLLDIYLCRLGEYKGVTGKNELYINQGDMVFREEAEKYNLDFVGFATQAAFFDMDNDGDLDVYLLNHSVHSENSFGRADLRSIVDSLAGDRIYRNDANYFVDVSSTSGIYQSTLGYGLGIGLSDFNKDGFTDVFISNDFMENDYLYLNNQEGSFRDVYPQMAAHTSLSSMGSDIADFNNDGLVDIITLDMLPEKEVIRKSTVGEDPHEIFRMKLGFGYMPQYKRNTLQLNRGDGTFSDIAMMAGVQATDWSWAPLFADFDNDGWKDLFISNGILGRPNDLDYLDFIKTDRIQKSDVPDSLLLHQMPNGPVSNYFFRNNHDLTFQDLSAEWGAKASSLTQGIAYSDLDNDGDLDLILNNLDGPASIKENKTNEDSLHHFLALDFTAKGGNTSGIGTKVEVFVKGKYQYFEVFPVRGFKSSVDHRIHIGLGSSAILDSIIVRWPSGMDTALYHVAAYQFLTLVELGSTTSSTKAETRDSLFTSILNDDLGIDFVHVENNFIEFNREQLIPHMHSTEGPALAVADVNGDGWDDFYIGGAKLQAGSIYQQSKDGFIVIPQPDISSDSVQEDVDAEFLDFDKDGDMDLVVVSGGNEYIGDSPIRRPRLYLNDGNGHFSKLDGIFDEIYHTGSTIAVHDYDHDGWEDLFLGSIAVPWNYGLSPQSYLLKNKEGKSFTDVSSKLPRGGNLGMINDAIWVDLGGNGQKDLVLAGEWMDVTILSPVEDGFDERMIPDSKGWWKAVQVMDYDGDGDLDLLLGNLGLNTKLKASIDDPIHLYLNDFDQNKRLDAVMTFRSNGEESIFASRRELEKQIPQISRRFPSNLEYARASPKEILGAGFPDAIKLSATELRSGVFLNDENEFHFLPFPNTMQMSIIRDFVIFDVDNDGFNDILSVGNLYAVTMQDGRYSADHGTVIFASEKGAMFPKSIEGLSIKGDMRKLETLYIQGVRHVLIARNNDEMQWLKVNQINSKE